TVDARVPVDRRPAGADTGMSKSPPRAKRRVRWCLTSAPCWPSYSSNAARHLVELRMPVDLVVRRIEKRADVVRGARRDRRRRDDPDAYALVPPRIDVARVLERLLRVHRMEAPRMLVRGGAPGGDEHLPQRPRVVVLFLL